MNIFLSLPPFHLSLPMLLLRGRDAAMLHFRPILTEAGLTEQQWRVLRALHDCPALDISSLAKQCHVLLPSMSGIVQRLEVKALVQRKENSYDQRSSLISLTPAGETILQLLMPRLNLRYQQIQEQLGEEKLEQLYTLLLELEDKLKS